MNPLKFSLVDQASYGGEKGDDMEDMTPKEAGKALGDFLKGLQESAEEK